MATFLWLCSSSVAAVLLVWTGAHHARHRASTAVLLSDHGVLPRPVHQPVAAVLPVVELGLGAGVVVALVSGPTSSAAVVATAGACVLAVAFGVYHGALRRSHHAGSCGCSPLATQARSRWSVAPACALLAAGVVGMVSRGAGVADLGAVRAETGVLTVLPLLGGASVAVVATLLAAGAPAPEEGR